MLDHSVNGWFSPYFHGSLVDLGAHESAAFAGVLCPRAEVGVPREGVNAVFLEDAEAYYQKYQGFKYWRGLLVDALKRAGVTDPKLVVEYGCGFGNATLPMLDIAPDCKVIASDISPNLLAILERLLVDRGLKERCVSVALDAQKPYLKEGCADLVFGAAILHHLVEPGPFISHAMRVLKPGGVGIFFEPLEGGQAILLSICEEIIREAKRREQWDHAIYVTGRLADALRPQIFRQAIEDWKDLDDKWAFPRSVIDGMAKDANSTATVYALHDNVGQFRRHFTYMLETYVEFDPTEYPDWAWDIFNRYDSATFSPDMLRDLALEGCITFRKNAG